MKNNFRYFLLIIFCSLLTLKAVNANEPFVFNVTEIEILDNGNQINGYEGGTATSEDGSTITAENFFYNKLTNILEATGSVKYIDALNDTIITSNKAIYFKNNEKVITSGNSKAINDNNTITASSLEYDKINNIFKAKRNAVAKDFLKNTTIYADEITYLKNKEKFFTTGGTSKAINDNNFIKASSLEYDKKNNIFKAIKDAVVNDFEKDTTIYADVITYFKNQEKILTKGKTTAFIQKKYVFNSKDVTYLRNTEKLFSQKKQH